MAQRIDWDRMYGHLERVLENVTEDVRAEHINVDLTLGKKPPRIYATFDRPEELSELTEDLSPGTDEMHRELCEKLEQKTHPVAEIMRKHGLRGYALNNPYFKGEDTFTTAYGYEHSQYRVAKK